MSTESLQDKLKYKKSCFLNPSDFKPPPRMRSVSPIPSRKETHCRSIYTNAGSILNEESLMNTEFTEILKLKSKQMPERRKELDVITEVSESRNSIAMEAVATSQHSEKFIPMEAAPISSPHPKQATDGMFSELKKENHAKYAKFLDQKKKNQVDQQLKSSFKKMKTKLDHMNEKILAQDSVLETLRSSMQIPERIEETKIPRSNETEPAARATNETETITPRTNEIEMNAEETIKSKLVPSFYVGMISVIIITLIIIYLNEGGINTEVPAQKQTEQKLSVFSQNGNQKGYWDQIADFLCVIWGYHKK